MALKKNPFRPHTSCEKMKTEFLIVSGSAGRMLSEVFTPGEISEIAPSISSSTFSSTPPIPGRHSTISPSCPSKASSRSLPVLYPLSVSLPGGREGGKRGRERGREEGELKRSGGAAS